MSRLKVESILTADSSTSVSEIDGQRIREADVLITDPGIFTNEEIFDHLDHVKWIQMFTAGVELVTRHYIGKPPPKFLLTRNVGFFDQQMAQYVIAQILYRERQFRKLESYQRQHLWEKIHSRPLDELTIGIVGFGSVGRKIAQIAASFEMKVKVLVREGSSQKQSDHDVSATTDLKQLLSSSDYVINILPNVSSTSGFFDGGVLEHCRHKKSVFVNIGRGNVVSNDTIIRALNKGWLSHAILDVFEREPLPADSHLWDRDDVTITPHISGSQFDPKKFVKKTLDNYRKFCDGSLKEVVDWVKGY